MKIPVHKQATGPNGVIKFQAAVIPANFLLLSGTAKTAAAPTCLIGGDTIKWGAIAAKYSHDNHNLLVVGRDLEDMAVAANTLIAEQGVSKAAVAQNSAVQSAIECTTPA